MPTEVWFRNPFNYIRECVELNAHDVVWDRGILRKHSIDPIRHANLYYPMGTSYRLLAAGDQGTAELRPGSTMERPFAVYPTWVYGRDPLEELELLLAHPVGQDEKACGDLALPPDERPVLGQEHRVVIIESPPANVGPGRKFFRELRSLQEDYPEAIVHVHGLYGYAVAFGYGFRSVDIDPRTSAQKGKVMLPSGKEMTFEQAAKVPQWVTLLNFRPVDLAVPRNRCMYNMRSAQWAGKHYTENIKFKSTGAHEPDIESSDENVKPATVSASKSKAISGTVGDKFLCDTCSLQVTCKYFRTGAVCSIPESDPSVLARFFKTRDSDLIVEGLGTLLAAQTRRLERGMADEAEYGELNPEVSRIMESLFKNGERLAKLVDPKLRAQPRLQVGVQVNGVGAAPALNNAGQGVAAIVAELEARGIPRSQITPEMIANVLSPEVIDVPALEASDE